MITGRAAFRLIVMKIGYGIEAMKPIETTETDKPFLLLLTDGKGIRIVETVMGENMAKQLVKAHGDLDQKTGVSNRLWLYRANSTPLTAQKIAECFR